jgi:hypothetical protein
VASLNKIAEREAYDLGKPLDHMLIENLKFSIRYYGATFIRQDVARNGLSPHYLPRYTTKLMLVDSADTCVLTTGCKILRTVDKIPVPIRLNQDFDFKYVGEPGHTQGYTYTELEERFFTQFNKFTSRTTRYAYVNGYIYVFPGVRRKYLTLQYAPESLNQMSETCANSMNCFTDDDDCFLPMDMITGILRGIREDTLKMVKADTEIEVNNKDNNG